MGGVALNISFKAFPSSLCVTGGIFLIAGGSLALISLVIGSLALACKKEEMQQKIPKFEVNVEELYAEDEEEKRIARAARSGLEESLFYQF